MPSATDYSPTAATSSLEADARRIAGQLERAQYVVLALFTVLYAIGAILHAHGKPLQHDEVITVIASAQPDVATTLEAASATDASPPLPHLLTHFCIQWFGAGDIATRVPAMVGFWLFCVCMFIFTRRLGIFYSLVAFLLPIATGAYSYAYEARAYGLELGFCGLALGCWQAAADGRRRWPTCAGLALSLTGAIFCHYYALFLYIPLAGAELFRGIRSKSVAWPIWLALAMGGAPMLGRLAIIAGVVKVFGHGTWAPVYREQIVEFWELGLQSSLSVVVVGLVFMAVWMMKQRTPANAAGFPPARLAPHELVACILFLAIPISGVGAGLLVTHMFAPRYAIFALTGAIILVTAMAAGLSGGRSLAGFLLLALALLPPLFAVVEANQPYDFVANEPVLVEALRRGPVAVPDGQLFLQLWHYASPEQRRNLLYLADNAAAAKYRGFDAIDGGLRVLRPWSTVQVLEYKDFASPGREFLVYQNSLRPGWLLSRVVDDGATVQAISYGLIRQLFRVRLK